MKSTLHPGHLWAHKFECGLFQVYFRLTNLNVETDVAIYLQLLSIFQIQILILKWQMGMKFHLINNSKMKFDALTIGL